MQLRLAGPGRYQFLPRSPVFFLSLILSAVLLFAGCPQFSADKIASIEKDLPTLISVATALATIGMGLAGVPAGDVATGQNISTMIVTALNVLQSAYQSYKSKPTSSNLEKLYAAEYAIHDNLPQELNAARIENADLRMRVTAGVNLVVATTDSFVALLPPPPVSPTGRTYARPVNARPIPSASEIKDHFNKDVCRMNPACKVN